MYNYFISIDMITGGYHFVEKIRLYPIAHSHMYWFVYMVKTATSF
jgi:hypothetical protein